MLAQILWHGPTRSPEVSCPTRYAPESSSIDLRGCIVYGYGCLRTAMGYWLAKTGVIDVAIFPRELRSACILD